MRITLVYVLEGDEGEGFSLENLIDIETFLEVYVPEEFEKAEAFKKGASNILEEDIHPGLPALQRLKTRQFEICDIENFSGLVLKGIIAATSLYHQLKMRQVGTTGEVRAALERKIQTVDNHRNRIHGKMRLLEKAFDEAMKARQEKLRKLREPA